MTARLVACLQAVVTEVEARYSRAWLADIQGWLGSWLRQHESAP